jgi:LPXTG-site transpeptidase (sortase) family protein
MEQERVTVRLPDTMRLPEEHAPRPLPWTRKLAWTLGNVLMLCGAYVLLYVGGLLADERYNVYAASGDTEDFDDVAAIASPAPVEAVRPAPTQAAAPADAVVQTGAVVQPDTAQTTNTGPARFDQVPFLNSGSNELTSAVPPQSFSSAPSTITRFAIPSLAEMGFPELDKKVIEVSYKVTDNLVQWDVDKYRVGHHQGTSNPGGGGNIVLSGHSGGTAYPFNDIRWLEPGAELRVYSNNQWYTYAVTETLVVDEVGQPFEKQQENAQYIQQTPSEVVTLVTCWPLADTPDPATGQIIPMFSQRVIVRAEPTKPAGNVAQSSENNDGGAADSWVAR